MKCILRCILISFLCLLSGCISVGKSPSLKVYAPKVEVAQKTQGSAVEWQLVVMKPFASQALDNNRIAVRPTPESLLVYEGAIWSDKITDLLQSAVVQAFEDSGKLPAVGRHASGMHGQYALLLDIRQFESVYVTGQREPNGTVIVQAKLLRFPQSTVLSSRTFSASITADSKDIPAAVRSIEAALNQVLSDMTDWVIQVGNANEHNVGGG